MCCFSSKWTARNCTMIWTMILIFYYVLSILAGFYYANWTFSTEGDQVINFFGVVTIVCISIWIFLTAAMEKTEWLRLNCLGVGFCVFILSFLSLVDILYLTGILGHYEIENSEGQIILLVGTNFFFAGCEFRQTALNYNWGCQIKYCDHGRMTSCSVPQQSIQFTKNSAKL